MIDRDCDYKSVPNPKSLVGVVELHLSNAELMQRIGLHVDAFLAECFCMSNNIKCL